MSTKDVKNYFQPDARWISVFKINNIEEYQAQFGIKVNFNSNVPKDLQKGGDVVKALMVYAYYNYDILDEVVRKLFGLFELSIKLKTIELGGELEKVNSNGKKRAIVLDTLIKRFKDEKDLESLVSALDDLRKSRNYYSNPKPHDMEGPIVLGYVEKVVKVINDMFKK